MKQVIENSFFNVGEKAYLIGKRLEFPGDRQRRI